MEQRHWRVETTFPTCDVYCPPAAELNVFSDCTAPSFPLLICVSLFPVCSHTSHKATTEECLCARLCPNLINPTFSSHLSHPGSIVPYECLLAIYQTPSMSTWIKAGLGREGDQTSDLVDAVVPHMDSGSIAARPLWSGSTQSRTLRNAHATLRLVRTSSAQLLETRDKLKRNPVSLRLTMLRQILLNSTDNPDFDLRGSVSVAALLRPTAARGSSGGGGMREGELHKPDLVTYIVMCLLLFLLVLLIVFFINCQLRNSFFASMPYDRSLREARTSYK
ncbi:hypothetical protein WMY93_010314 [Mugilogobius chulae]|uniref:Uncharacterized protein n=1 Tax=Mugilogobius chulae TaxID=88201 RepID=A0AAW0P8A0_9GOBI